CGGGHRHAKGPEALGKLPQPIASAFREEAIGDPIKAVDGYAKALELAVQIPEDPASVAVTMAALDALVHRDVAAFSDVSSSSALADRVAPADLEKKGGTVEARLAKIQEKAEGPFAPGLVARARLALAERHGDAKMAETLRAQTG